MARNKAIFDADILINMFETESLEYIINNLEKIYISDYVFKYELKNDSMRNKIQKLINKDKVKILYYKDLTYVQTTIRLTATAFLVSALPRRSKITTLFNYCFTL